MEAASNSASEIENRIIPGTGARELSRLAAIRLNLRSDAFISEVGLEDFSRARRVL